MLAKIVDWTLFFLPSVFAAYFATMVAAPALLGTSDAWCDEHLGRPFLFVALALGPFVLDALLLACFGGTIGRWFFDLRVCTADGRKPPFGKAVKRTLLLWARGMGLSLPIVNIAAMAIAYTGLRSNGVASWDRDSGLLTIGRKLSVGRMVGALVVAFFLLLLIFGHH